MLEYEKRLHFDEHYKKLQENHSVRDKGLPCKLLTDGFYSKVRHPMYGTFIIMYSGIMLSIRSLNGVLITVLIVAGQYTNAFLEEKRLRSLFKEEYTAYCSKTKGKVLTKIQIVVLSFAVIITFWGLNY